MIRHLMLLVICASWSDVSHAEIRLGSDSTLVFATVEEGRQILTARDDFVRRMSPFDRAARMKTNREVSENEYLEFVGNNVLEWNVAEERKITSAVQRIQAELMSFRITFPNKVFLIKTTGNEEGNAAYTRANAIVLPEPVLGSPTATIQKLICHELFHVLTRAYPALREKLYAVIGFVKCDEPEFPLELQSRRITNPDAPRNDHCIRLRVGNADRWAVPILFSSREKYDVQRGGEFFNYLQLQFLLIDRSDTAIDSTNEDRPRPVLVDLHEVAGFYEQVGRNTDYIIHPEEILADNFALLVVRDRNTSSPEIISKLEQILKDEGPAEPSD